MDEKPVDHCGACERDQSPWVIDGQADRDHGIGKPRQPLKEIIGMAGVAPQTDLANRAFRAGRSCKSGQLCVGCRFADNRNGQDCETKGIAPAEWRGVAGGGKNAIQALLGR